MNNFSNFIKNIKLICGFHLEAEGKPVEPVLDIPVSDAESLQIISSSIDKAVSEGITGDSFVTWKGEVEFYNAQAMNFPKGEIILALIDEIEKVNVVSYNFLQNSTKDELKASIENNDYNKSIYDFSKKAFSYLSKCDFNDSMISRSDEYLYYIDKKIKNIISNLNSNIQLLEEINPAFKEENREMDKVKANLSSIREKSTTRIENKLKAL
jgi:hypothetical protein